jgi:hypothetical protein
MDVPEVRRRVRGAIEKARQQAVERRSRSDAAARDYEEFLAKKAVPLFHQIASALVAEGHPFKIFSPAGSVRLASDRSPEDFVELVLDTDADPPQVIGRTSRGRGRRMITAESPIEEHTPIAALTEEQVLAFVLGELISLL